MLKSLLRLAITITEKALRTAPRPRCVRGGSVGARAVRARPSTERGLSGQTPAAPVSAPQSKPVKAGVNA